MVTKRQIRGSGIVLLVASAIIALAAMWWWAIRGMDDDISNAWFFTVIALALGGYVTCAYSSIEKE